MSVKNGSIKYCRIDNNEIWRVEFLGELLKETLIIPSFSKNELNDTIQGVFYITWDVYF